MIKCNDKFYIKTDTEARRVLDKYSARLALYRCYFGACPVRWISGMYQRSSDCRE